MIAMSASREMVKAAADSGIFQETIQKPFDVSRVLDFAERYAAVPHKP
jgi:hypothetical protein